jgi:transposase
MKSQQRYTTEFRAEAVRMLEQEGLSQAQAARRLGIPEGTLSNWVMRARATTAPAVGPGSQSVAELQAEVKRLRKELTRAQLERDILKKAAAYFAKESLPGTHS